MSVLQLISLVRFEIQIEVTLPTEKERYNSVVVCCLLVFKSGLKYLRSTHDQFKRVEFLMKMLVLRNWLLTPHISVEQKLLEL